VQIDPIRFGGGDTNLYRFLNNAPADGTDPTGLSELVQEPVGGQIYIYEKGDEPGLGSYIFGLIPFPFSQAYTLNRVDRNKRVGYRMVGVLDPESKLVYRNGVAVPLSDVESEVGDVKDWDKFFKDKGICEKERGQGVLWREEMGYKRFRNDKVVGTKQIEVLAEVGVAASPLGLPFAPSTEAASLFRQVAMRKGVAKAGQVAGKLFEMSPAELEFATHLLQEGAQVYRAKQGANLGDFIVIYKGRTYAVEVGAVSKTTKQLSAVEKTCAKGVEKLSGSYKDVSETILRK
jgi:hypothetical protein